MARTRGPHSVAISTPALSNLRCITSTGYSPTFFTAKPSPMKARKVAATWSLHCAHFS